MGDYLYEKNESIEIKKGNESKKRKKREKTNIACEREENVKKIRQNNQIIDIVSW